MTDADKIRSAFCRVPAGAFRERERYRVPLIEPVSAMPRPSDFDASSEPVFNAVEFRIERGAYNGTPWGRVIGSLRDTEIVVAEGPR